MMGRMKFNAEQCVGCYACHMACLDAHHNAREIHARSFRGISKVMDEEKGLSYEICPGVHIQWRSMCQSLSPGCGFPGGRLWRLSGGSWEKCIGCGVCTKAGPRIT
ncbi:MAG: hypothetical protein ACLUUO_08565 [Sellimonas intestinalis]